jgi:hypothetical protein
MGLARFVARDLYRPASSKQELDELLSEMDGVLDWTIHDADEVTVDYDRHRISDEVIEAALAGIGFDLKHIFADPYVPEDEARDVLLDEAST